MKLMRHIFLLTLYLILNNGCGSQLRTHRGIEFSPGVDSLVAVQADSITALLFTTDKNKAKAVNWFGKANHSFAIAESLWLDLQNTTQTYSDSVHPQIDLQKRNQPVLQQIITAEDAANRAITYNPFDFNALSLLARIYFFHGQLTENPIFYRKSIDVLGQIIEREKGEHSVYFRLGECYYQMLDWDAAFTNYQQAEKVLLATAYRKIDTSKTTQMSVDSVDQAIHFRYVYHQAIAKAKQYDNENALNLFMNAKSYAVSKADSELVENYIEWIQWDGGNIATAEKKNQLLLLIQNKQYAAAKDGLEALIHELHTQSAKDEINWQIALIEYEFMDQKKQACARMRDIVKRISNDLPAGSKYVQYATDAGLMFYKLGFDYKKQSKYKVAIRCFSTASDIEWYGKNKSLLELAKLSIHDSNQTLKIIDKILEDVNGLSVQEQLQAQTLKLNALKRFGGKRLAEIQETYRQIRRLQNN